MKRRAAPPGLPVARAAASAPPYCCHHLLPPLFSGSGSTHVSLTTWPTMSRMASGACSRACALPRRAP